MFELKYHSQDLSQLTFLVTGGAGFIGSNLVEYLLKNGAKKVRVLDNLSNGFRHNISEFESNQAFEFVEGDIRDLDICHQCCEGIDYISHQAALGSVPRSIKDPILTNSANITGFLNMLVAARDSGAKKIIYAASSSTYGDSKELPKKEERIGMPLSPYAVTKYTNELYAHVFALNYNLDIVGLRYFNVFGPKQDPNGAYAAVIPLFIKALVEGAPATINGDGKQTRDFTFVENAVQANMRAFFANDVKGEVFNVAVGDRTDLNDIWAVLQDILQSDLEPNYGPPRQGDIRDSQADISKIGAMLGYDPQFDFKQGLEITAAWFKNNFDLYFSKAEQ